MPARRLVAVLMAILAVFASLAYLIMRPQILKWGAKPDEAERAMAGDELISNPILVATRAISIKAGPERVRFWLAQMGQGRGGFYSYAWLENLIGLEIHNSDRIIPELQDLKPGDLIPFWRGSGVNAVVVEPPRLLVLAGTLNPPKGHSAGGGAVGGTWVFALDEPEAQLTRLIVRSRVAGFQPAWLSTPSMRVLEPVHFMMEQKMLRGIKARAERE